MEPLDPRKQSILQAVILEYVSAAEPVGSELIAQKYDLGVRSATIRNELAEMSELGFLEQPHTSAGRIPSDLGYRYYVDHLIFLRDPEAGARQKVLDATEDGEALQALLQDTTKVLSRLTQLLSAATTVRNTGVTVKSAFVTALGPDRALLILVLSNGQIENRLLECPQGMTLDHIGKANEFLKPVAEGRSVASVQKLKSPASTGDAALDKLLTTIVSTLRSISRELTRGKLITEGEEYMFAQPEFQRNAEYFSELMRSLEDEQIMFNALTEPTTEAQTVTIGKENQLESLRQFTVIRSRFYVGKNEAGTLAVVGPTRLNYDRAIPLLSFAAKAMSETLTKLMK